MGINIFKRNKKNNKVNEDKTIIEIDKTTLERNNLIKEIGEEEINSLCFYFAIKKDNLSIHLLNILKDNPSLIEKIKYSFTDEIFEKINNNTLTLEDIPTYKLDLLDLPIFSEKEERRIKLLKKEISLNDNYYAYVTSETFIEEIKSEKVVEETESYIENIKLKKIKYILPNVDDAILRFCYSKFIYIHPEFKKEYNKDTDIKFDEKTIIITDYNTFLELTRNNIDLVEKYNFILDNNYEKINNIDSILRHNRFNDNYNRADNLIKINHLLYLIDNSDLEDKRKKYYSYYLKKEYDKLIRYYYYNDSNFKKLIKEFEKELGKEYIVENTEKYNSLSTEEKNKKIITDKFDVSIFLESIGNIDNISCMDLFKKINSLEEEQKIIVFKDDGIKKKLRTCLQVEQNDLYRYFREIFNYIKPNEFLELYKNIGIKKFSNELKDYELYKAFVCMCEKDINEPLKIICNDEILFDEFFTLSHYFYGMFYNLDYELLKKIIFKMEKDNFKYKLDFFTSVDSENQIKLLNEDIKDKTILELIPFMKKESLNYFFENNIRARHLYREINIVSLINSGVKFNIDIIKNKDFFDRLKDESFITFRNNINNVERYNDPTYIEKRLKEYYEELLSNYNYETKIFREYEKELLERKWNVKNNDYILSSDVILKFGNLVDDSSDEQELIEYLKKQTSKKISEIVIDALFQDNIYNVYLNINEMIRFNDTLSKNERILDKEKLEFYKIILNFDNIESDKKIEIYNNLKDKNYNLTFYEDLRKLKDISYDKIQDEILKPNEHPEYLDKDNTSKYGVDIYDLREKKYTILVRSQSKFYEKTNTVRNCYSLISNENSSVFGDKKSYHYGYNNFEKDKILHVLETDAFSSSQKDDSSKFVNRIMTPKEIVNSDSWYSEIQIVNTKDESTENRYNANKPNYIVVFDYVNEQAIEESKRLNIPIVIITHKRLDKEHMTNIKLDDKKDIYINDSISEIKKKSSRR